MLRRSLLAVVVLLAHAGLVRADRPAPPKETENSIGLRLVEIPAGEFQMGSGESGEQIARAFPDNGRKPDYFSDELPQHRIRITRPFLLGKYEVTIGEYRKFVEETGYRTEAERDGLGGWGYNPEIQQCEGRRPQFHWKNPGFPQTDRHPVLNVTWNDAVAFCQWLSKKEKRTYRLPTEAEWEYACRAGTKTRYIDGDDPAGLFTMSRTLNPKVSDPKLHVQEVLIPRDGSIPFTAPVGSFSANPFGLHDMHGNAWEWTADWYGEEYFRTSPVDDPTGPPTGKVRVRRGGGWNSFPLWVRASFRNWNTPASRCVNLGFRVAANLVDDDAAGGTVQAGAANVSREAGTPDRKTVSLLFVGDIMLDGGPGHVVASGQDPFEPCGELLRSADFAVGNLECVLGRGGSQLLKAYTFRAADGSETLLKKHFAALSLANNHSGDFGVEGFQEALRILDDSKIPYFGGGRNIAAARAPLLLEKHGRRIALLGYNGFRPHHYTATLETAGSAPLVEELILEDIRSARTVAKADIVIPFLHWGSEMVPMPRASHVALARKMIDAGASAVIGAHPHITQTVDVYKGAPIVYSLGNFVFDYFPVDPPEWTGWAVRLTFPAAESGAAGTPQRLAPDLETIAVTLDPAGIPRPVTVEEVTYPPVIINPGTAAKPAP